MRQLHRHCTRPELGRRRRVRKRTPPGQRYHRPDELTAKLGDRHSLRSGPRSSGGELGAHIIGVAWKLTQEIEARGGSHSQLAGNAVEECRAGSGRSAASCVRPRSQRPRTQAAASASSAAPTAPQRPAAAFIPTESIRFAA